MNKCPQCGAVLKTLTRICEACGSEIKAEAAASAESSKPTSAGLSAAELATQINEGLADLKSKPPTSKIKSFVVGLITVPTIGLGYLVVKALSAFGSGRSPERVKLALDQSIRTAETSFKSDPDMKALIDKGSSELKSYGQMQHGTRTSFGMGVIVSIILCVTIPLVIQHQAKVRMEQAAAIAQIEAAAAKANMEKAAAAARMKEEEAKVQMEKAIVIAQNDPLKRLCIGPVITIKSVVQKASDAGQSTTLQQTLETLDTTLIDQANVSHKFEVVARNDSLKSILNEQSLGASGNVDPATAAQVFKLVGAQYLVLATVTDFAMMGNEVVKFASIGASAKRESVRISCGMQIYDTTTGKLIESARFRGQDANVSRAGVATSDGASLTKITDRLAADMFTRIVNVIYPAKVVGKTGTQITINRAEGAGVTIGQAWSVFALGDEITDPDTGRKLGRNETEVGTIKIVRTTPTLSYGEAVEDNGIAMGNIVRPKQVDAPMVPAANSELKPADTQSTVAPKSAKPPQDKSISDKIKDDM